MVIHCHTTDAINASLIAVSDVMSVLKVNVNNVSKVGGYWEKNVKLVAEMAILKEKKNAMT